MPKSFVYSLFQMLGLAAAAAGKRKRESLYVRMRHFQGGILAPIIPTILYTSVFSSLIQFPAKSTVIWNYKLPAIIVFQIYADIKLPDIWFGRCRDLTFGIIWSRNAFTNRPVGGQRKVWRCRWQPSIPGQLGHFLYGQAPCAENDKINVLTARWAPYWYPYFGQLSSLSNLRDPKEKHSVTNFYKRSGI